MTTTGPVREATTTDLATAPGRHRPVGPLLAIAVVVAAVLGFGAGWLAFGGDGGGAMDEFPIGSYVDRFAGSHTFDFHDDGTYRYCEGATCVAGVFAVHGDLYTEMTHDYSGLPMVPATYEWAFVDDELTFRLVGEEMLPDRGRAMSGVFVPAD